VQLHVLKAATAGEIDTALADVVPLRAAALIEQADPFFFSRRQQFALLAARHAIPAIYEGRQFAEPGGLISYGSSLPAVYHQVGAYAGRVLKGEKPADLPVMQ
jgi:putative ABC transport system substrate-binding protein